MTDKMRWFKVNFIAFVEDGDEYGEEGRIFVRAHDKLSAIKIALSDLRERNANVGIGILSIEAFNPNQKIDFKKVAKFDGPHSFLKGANK